MAATPDRLTLHLERLLPAPRAAVFAAATEPGWLAEWWGPAGFTAPRVEVDLRVGGRYRIAMKPPGAGAFHLTGRFERVEPPVALDYTFRWEEPDPDDRETLVRLRFLDDPRGTRLAVDHGAFATEARRALHRQGWSESLDRLAEHLSAPAARTDGPGPTDRPGAV
jgi:uncharacterized protein YndB with AHSA1/START domain